MKRTYYYIILAFIIAAGTGFFLYNQYGIIKNEAIEAEKTRTVAYIQNRATETIHQENFDAADAAR